MKKNIAKVDAIMCIWNSNKPYFSRCLKSVKKEVPIHHFIVVDRYSTDNTLEVIKKYFTEPTLKIVQTKENLARARQIGISHVDTEYFAFIDDDVELPGNWFHRLTSKIDAKVGAIHQLDEHIMINNPVYDKWVKWKISWTHFRKNLPAHALIDVTAENVSQTRGYTHNTVIKTDLVRDWKPSSILSSYEDWMIMKHIVKKGFVWRIVNVYDIKHFSSDRMREFFRKLRWDGAGTRITGFAQLSLRRILWESVKQSVKAFRAGIELKEPRIILYGPLTRLFYLDGYLRWNKFIVMVRK